MKMPYTKDNIKLKELKNYEWARVYGNNQTAYVTEDKVKEIVADKLDRVEKGIDEVDATGSGGSDGAAMKAAIKQIIKKEFTDDV